MQNTTTDTNRLAYCHSRDALSITVTLTTRDDNKVGLGRVDQKSDPS
jgi:hypothetical protein